MDLRYLYPIGMDPEEVYLASNSSKTTLSPTPTTHSTNKPVKSPPWGPHPSPLAAETSSSHPPSPKPPPHTFPLPQVETSLSNLTFCPQGTTLSVSSLPGVWPTTRVIQEE